MIRAGLLLLIASIVSAKLYTEYEPAQKFMWEEFKREHHRDYATMEEEVTRFGHFLENLQLADKRFKYSR